MYNGKKIAATIEARMLSSRLPGKVLLSLAERPVLQLLIERIKASKYVDYIVVATTEKKDDDPIVDLAKHLGVRYFRGSEEDVLTRVLGAAESVSGDILVELTGDCPLLNDQLVDRGIDEFFGGEFDYASNDLKPGYPQGLSVQVFPVSVLRDAGSRTSDPIDRVHVSYYIYSHPELYRLHSWAAEDGAHAPELRITLDERSDYELLNAVCDHFAAKITTVAIPEIVSYLRSQPALASVNKNVRQKDASEG